MLWNITVILICIGGLAQGQFSGPNIALKKPASQYPGDFCNNACYYASLAVDGLFDRPNEWDGHCSHTNVQNTTDAYWTVNFTENYYITGIIVYNRKSTVAIGRRLRDFSIYGMNKNQPSDQALYTYNYNFTDDNYQIKIMILLTDAPSVSGIRIRIPNRNAENTILTLCEVEVFSDLTCPKLVLNNYTIPHYTNHENNGSIASFSCVNGTETDLNLTTVCKLWECDEQPPECKIVYCPFPPAFKNGNYTILGTCLSNQNGSLAFNCTIKPECEIGFNLTHNTVRYCLQSKQWSEDDPECERVKCHLPNIKQGSYKYNNGSVIAENTVDYASKIQVKCNPGYNSSSGIDIECLKDATLSGSVPECIIVTCNHPGQIQNGSYINETNQLFTKGIMNYSQIIKVVCDRGYKIASGSKERICQETGTWSGTDATCIIVTCPNLQTFSGVINEYSDGNTILIHPVGSFVNITCEKGMLQEGSNYRYCTETGVWSGTNTTCTIVSNSPSSGQPAALIGGVTGSVVALLIIIVFIVVILKRRGVSWVQRKQVNKLNDLQEDVQDSTITVNRAQLNYSLESQLTNQAVDEPPLPS